jgi:hypothetical protein
MAGSPIGLSLDLNSLTNDTFEMLRSYIEGFKERRAFYMSAVTRIIADTASVTALEYSTPDLSEIELTLFVDKLAQSDITLYPEVRRELVYVDSEGREIDGTTLAEDGIDFKIKKSYSCSRVVLRAKSV